METVLATSLLSDMYSSYLIPNEKVRFSIIVLNAHILLLYLNLHSQNPHQYHTNLTQVGQIHSLRLSPFLFLKFIHVSSH